MDDAERKTILIVDDYAPNLMALAAVLDSPEYDVIEATSGPQALEIARSRDVTLILLDIQMPGMDGYEVAREIRNHPKTREIPIIFVTAVYKEDPAVRKGYAAGGQDYLGKPFDPEVLRAKVAVYANLFSRATSLERRQRELVESEARYRQIVEGAQDIIATIDSGGIITSLNLAFERTTGFPCAEWVGKSFLPLLDADDGRRLLASLAGDTGAGQLVDVGLRTSDGERLPVEISVQPVLRLGDRAGAIGVMRDLSRRNRSGDRP
jgi:PAS domain S-box-containing protein